jgi:hypothetical protein
LVSALLPLVAKSQQTSHSTLALHVFSFISAMLLSDAERSEASDYFPSAIVDRRIAAGFLFRDQNTN